MAAVSPDVIDELDPVGKEMLRRTMVISKLRKEIEAELHRLKDSWPDFNETRTALVDEMWYV